MLLGGFETLSLNIPPLSNNGMHTFPYIRIWQFQARTTKAVHSRTLKSLRKVCDCTANTGTWFENRDTNYCGWISVLPQIWSSFFHLLILILKLFEACQLQGEAARTLLLDCRSICKNQDAPKAIPPKYVHTPRSDRKIMTLRNGIKLDDDLNKMKPSEILRVCRDVVNTLRPPCCPLLFPPSSDPISVYKYRETTLYRLVIPACAGSWTQ